MKILLVNPLPVERETYTLLPNIGLGYCASSIKNAYEVVLIDCVLSRIDYQRFGDILRREHADAVGFSVFTRSIGSVREYIKIARRIDEKLIIIVGGPHAIFEPEETMYYTMADYVFCGEAEESLPKLLSLLKINRKPPFEELEKIPNLVWQNESGNIIVNPRSYADVNSNPMPAWDIIHPERYPAAPNGIFSRARKIAPIVVTRGCPYPCTFCGAGIASGKKLRKRNIDNVIEEIKLLRNKYGIEEIHIMDDNFTLDMDYAKGVCRAIIRENIKMNFACPNGIRLDRLDEELLKLMEKAGFYSFAVGIESGSQKTLNYMKKELTIEKIRETINLIKSTTNIEITGFFILGYPNENQEDVNRTIKFARELNIDKANFFNFIPFPGSVEYSMLKKEGKLKNLDYDKLYIHTISFHNDKITNKMLKWLQIKAHVLFYIRPRILMKLLREIKTLTQVKIILRRAVKILF